MQVRHEARSPLPMRSQCAARYADRVVLLCACRDTVQAVYLEMQRTMSGCYCSAGSELSLLSRLCCLPCFAGVYGPKLDVRSVTAEDMLSVYSVNCVGPLLVVQGLLKAGLIGGFGGKSLVANVSSKVRGVPVQNSLTARLAAWKSLRTVLLCTASSQADG
jgi:hypothetical protein